jgi:hypothetical protein
VWGDLPSPLTPSGMPQSRSLRKIAASIPILKNLRGE